MIFSINLKMTVIRRLAVVKARNEQGQSGIKAIAAGKKTRKGNWQAR